MASFASKYNNTSNSKNYSNNSLNNSLNTTHSFKKKPNSGMNNQTNQVSRQRQPNQRQPNQRQPNQSQNNQPKEDNKSGTVSYKSVVNNELSVLEIDSRYLNSISVYMPTTYKQIYSGKLTNINQLLILKEVKWGEIK